MGPIQYLACLMAICRVLWREDATFMAIVLGHTACKILTAAKLACTASQDATYPIGRIDTATCDRLRIHIAGWRTFSKHCRDSRPSGVVQCHTLHRCLYAAWYLLFLCRRYSARPCSVSDCWQPKAGIISRFIVCMKAWAPLY